MTALPPVSGQLVLHVTTYPTSASGIIILLKTPKKISRILPDFICKPTDFYLVFNFEQMRTVTIFEENGITAHIP